MKPGDEVILSEMEHHANIVPWQIAASQFNIKLKYIPVNNLGELEIEKLESLITKNTKLISVIHVSNTLGTINDIKEICNIAKKYSIPVAVDGAQAIAHLPVDVQDLGCDFYSFSGHKLYGPTGIGVMWGKEALLDKMLPYQGGGDMILSVSYDESIFNDLPYKFEAGTPAIAEAIGLSEAINYLKGFDWQVLKFREEQLLKYATDKLMQLGKNINLFGEAPNKVGIISFTINGIHPHDIGTILDNNGVAIRTGHHCNMPLIKKFGLNATARASFALYNTKEDVDAFINGIINVKKLFKVS
jgi:cysteine desulfurase/selenocysteine lyase